jgi:uncharacterized coiled-coil protein SlyX
MTDLMKKALALITSQEQRIKELAETIAVKVITLVEFDKQIARLTEEVERLKKSESEYEAFIRGLNPVAMTKEAQTFIVKKFVTELKCEDFLTDIFGEKVYFIEEKKLDKIAKIILEGKDEKS